MDPMKSEHRVKNGNELFKKYNSLDRSCCAAPCASLASNTLANENAVSRPFCCSMYSTYSTDSPRQNISYAKKISSFVFTFLVALLGPPRFFTQYPSTKSGCP